MTNARRAWLTFLAMDLKTRNRGVFYISDHFHLPQYDIVRHNFEAANDNDDAIQFIYDDELRRLLQLWIACGKDDILTRLSWGDAQEN